MIRIKMCGLRRPEDIAAVNETGPEYIGFVFAEKSRRRVSSAEAETLRANLREGITPVGVFVNAGIGTVAGLLEQGVIDMAQLHGEEDEAYIAALRTRTNRPLIQAFRIRSGEDIRRAEASSADMILLDAGAGDGRTFDWSLLRYAKRPFFLAGGLTPENVGEAVETLQHFGVDVSSGIETEGYKDPIKMRAFLRAVREKGNR